MNVREETEIALKDAYWAEVRKLYANYLHACSIAQGKQGQIDNAESQFKLHLAEAREALTRCLDMMDEVKQV